MRQLILLFAATHFLPIFVSRYQEIHYCTYSKEQIAMNENIRLNEHNKAEHPPMHNEEFDISQTF